MKVGQVSQTIEVSGAVPVLKTEATQVDTIIDAATNDNLPLAIAQLRSIDFACSGRDYPRTPAVLTTATTLSGYGGRPLINGNREQANNFLLDGMDNNQVSDNLLGFTPCPGRHRRIQLHHQQCPSRIRPFHGRHC